MRSATDIIGVGTDACPNCTEVPAGRAATYLTAPLETSSIPQARAPPPQKRIPPATPAAIYDPQPKTVLRKIS